MYRLFHACTSISELDLSHFDTSKVTNMVGMFDSIWRLTELDLSSFDTSNVTEMSQMFYHCSNLKTIYVSHLWDTSKLEKSSNMFYYCPSLVGPKGTTFDENYIDKTYARVDGGTSSPGYLTLKTS